MSEDMAAESWPGRQPWPTTEYGVQFATGRIDGPIWTTAYAHARLKQVRSRGEEAVLLRREVGPWMAVD